MARFALGASALPADGILPPRARDDATGMLNLSAPVSATTDVSIAASNTIHNIPILSRNSCSASLSFVRMIDSFPMYSLSHVEIFAVQLFRFIKFSLFS